MCCLQHHLPKSLHPFKSRRDSSDALVFLIKCSVVFRGFQILFHQQMSNWNCSGLVAKKNDQTYQDIIFKGQVQTAKCDKSSPIFSGSQRNALAKMCLPKPIGPADQMRRLQLRDETLQHLGCIWNILWKPLISIGAVSYLSTRCISWLQMASLAIFSTVQNRSTHTYFISNKYSRNNKSCLKRLASSHLSLIYKNTGWWWSYTTYSDWTIPTGARFCPSRNIN